MSDRANTLALKAALRCLIVLALLFGVRYVVATPNLLPSIEWSQPLAASTDAPKPVATPEPVATPKPTAVPKERPRSRDTPREGNWVKLEVATPAPPKAPRHVAVAVEPKTWSRRIQIPEGMRATASFTLGRVRVEVNGVDKGLFFRRTILQGEVENGRPRVTGVNPFASADRRPRILIFDGDARTLRFQSGERVGGEVVVEFTE